MLVFLAFLFAIYFPDASNTLNRFQYQIHAKSSDDNYSLTNMEEFSSILELSVLLSLNNPIELVKSRYQTMNQLIARGSLLQNYQGLRDCALSVANQEGLRALWKGNSISLLRFFPFEALSFQVKQNIQDLFPNGFLFNIFSGLCGGLFASTVFYPIDTTRVLITTSKENISSSLHLLKKSIRYEGFKYLYRGFGSCLLSIIIFRGMFYGVYDTFKGMTSNIYQKWFIAYSAGLIAGFSMYPLETLRKRNILSSEKIEQWKLLKKVAVTQGLKSLYRGCSLIPLQSFLASGVLLYFDKEKK